ncbi:MAG: 7-cyano-7-deazaguanine synthase [Prevotellaceae bacterium]|nr:7-cyano-7-deazaguanine synthase [Prevotellaceae bacterium]
MEEELRAIETISEKIRKNPETKATLLPLRIVNVKDIPEDKIISDAYIWVKEHNIVEYGLKRFPKQYEYLARFCKSEGIFCELGIEKGEHSRIYQVINSYGKLQKIIDNDVEYWKLDESKSEQQLVNLLKYFHFPIPLYHMSKLEEVEGYKKLGFENVINDTWFCHHPVKGKPCGFCSPCRQVVAAKMSYRLPKPARRRNKVAYVYLFWTDKILPLKKKILKKIGY